MMTLHTRAYTCLLYNWSSLVPHYHTLCPFVCSPISKPSFHLHVSSPLLSFYFNYIVTFIHTYQFNWMYPFSIAHIKAFFRTDHLVLNNQLRELSLGRIDFPSQQALTACSSSSRDKALWISFSHPHWHVTWVIIVQILHRPPYCWHFMDAASLSCIEDTDSRHQQTSPFWLLQCFHTPWYPLSLRYGVML